MGLEPIHDRGLRQIQSEYPQAHIEKGKYNDLVIVPSFRLPSGWLAEKQDEGCEPANICTVLFLRSPGFPAAKPDHFWVDLRLRLKDLSVPTYANYGNEIHGFPQWTGLTWFSWHLQMWDPNRSSLYTFLKCIHQRLKPAR